MTEAGFQALFLGADADMLRHAKLFAIIYLVFLMEPAAGGLGLPAWPNKALWAPSLLLLVAWLLLAGGWRKQARTLPLQSS